MDHIVRFAKGEQKLGSISQSNCKRFDTSEFLSYGKYHRLCNKILAPKKSRDINKPFLFQNLLTDCGKYTTNEITICEMQKF